MDPLDGPLIPLVGRLALWQPDGYTYGYRGYSGSCPERNGQFFIIAVRLEVLYREQSFTPVVDCTGGTIPWPREVVALSAFDPLEGETQARPLPIKIDPEVRARDQRRKADLLAMRDQLRAYRQQHGRYPCPGDGLWAFSSSGPNWITDDPATCGLPGAPAALAGPVPIDPVNQPGPFWGGALTYGYRAYRSGCPEATRGQYFMLGTRLEDATDPELARRPRDCTGDTIPWPDNVFTISSED